MQILKMREPERNRSSLDMYLSRALSLALYVYVSLYFLVPYKPWGFIVSLHTPVLGIGLILIVVRVLACPDFRRSLLKPDLYLFSLMFLLFLISALLVNLKVFSGMGFQGYLISFLSFIFVRTAVAELDLKYAYKLANYYLIICGVLILLQVNLSGVYYVSGLMGFSGYGVGTPGWGFANGHILCGGMLAWLLSVTITKYLFYAAEERASHELSLQLASIALGAVGLFFTFNRGAWLGIFVVVAVLAFVAFSAGLPRKYLAVPLLVIVVAISFGRFFTRPAVSEMRLKESFFVNFLQKPTETISSESSTNTRAKVWRYTLGLIKENPVWGIGVDQFSKTYNKAYYALRLEANGIFDDNPNINPHNSYLYYMVEFGGIPALSLFLLVGWVFFKGFRSDCSSDIFPFWAGLLAVCVWVITNDYMRERIFWIVLGAASGLAHLKAANQSEVSNNHGVDLKS